MTPTQFIQIRTQANLSRAELAKALRVTEMTIWRWEYGQRKISGQTAIHMENIEKGDRWWE